MTSDTEEPMIVRMARAFEEAQFRDSTDYEGNPITWESQTPLRQQHVLACMLETLAAMKGSATFEMIMAPDEDLLPQGTWDVMIQAAIEEGLEHLETTVEPAEEQRQKIKDILNDDSP